MLSHFLNLGSFIADKRERERLKMSKVDLLKTECELNAATVKFNKADRLQDGTWFVSVKVKCYDSRPSTKCGYGKTVKEAKEDAAGRALTCDALKCAKQERIRRDARLKLKREMEEQSKTQTTVEMGDLDDDQAAVVAFDDLERATKAMALTSYKDVMTEIEFEWFTHELHFLDKDSINYDLCTVADAIINKRFFVVDKSLKTLQIYSTVEDALKAGFGDKPPPGTRTVWPLGWEKEESYLLSYPL